MAASIGDDNHAPSTPTFGGIMKRTNVFLAVALASAASAATVASAQSNLPAAHSSAAATVQLRRTNLGSILVSSSGRTLYEFTRDRGNKNSCAAISGCSAVWPSLKASGRPTAGAGIQASLLSTTSGRQVTYAGHPLDNTAATAAQGRPPTSAPKHSAARGTRSTPPEVRSSSPRAEGRRRPRARRRLCSGAGQRAPFPSSRIFLPVEGWVPALE